MKKLLALILGYLIAASSAIADDSGDLTSELWVMIKIDTPFRTQNEIELVEVVTSAIESKGSGELDGHSSGGFQFEFNYYGIKDYEAAKNMLEEIFQKNYPELTYTISNEYQVKYEKL
ncbi:hypothetical protein [Pleionea sediminis]|uniref:hypothetical protein n=1 Tax=Pleionea sediminis TaxID=2569479 RepID=UPI001184A29B|nr:hypothetical protein [Pleionea sediminis]